MRSRVWSDWVGFLWYVGSAIWMLIGGGTFNGLLLLPAVYQVSVAGTFLYRGRAQAEITGVVPRATAYIATMFVPIAVRTAMAWRPSLIVPTTVPWLTTAGVILWAVGLGLGFWPLWYLRRSFSIEPAARELVTSGPYRFLRHPMYVCYAINFTGVCLLHFAPFTVAITVTWMTLTYVRARYEERVLAVAFPDYGRR